MRPYTIKIYQDLAGEWRWHMVAPNGKIVADSAEGYVSRGNVERAIRRLIHVTDMLNITVE